MTRNLLLSGGPAHEFGATSAVLADLLAAQGVVSTVVEDPVEAFARLRDAELGRGSTFSLVTVHALHWSMDGPRYAHLRDRLGWSLSAADARTLDRFVRSGGGLLALHTAVVCFDAHPVWRELCGAVWRWGTSSHPPLGAVEVSVTEAGHRHEITAGLGEFRVEDEVYRCLDADAALVPLLTAVADGPAHPVLWAREVGAGRVVTDLLGHGTASLLEPTHGQVLARAAAWARAGRATTNGGVGAHG